MLQPYRDDPLCEAVERAIDAGIVVVAAAGNYGQTADGRAHLRQHHVAGQPSWRDHRRRARHEGTADRSDDTRRGVVSSRGPTMYDLRDEAGSGGAGHAA